MATDDSELNTRPQGVIVAVSRPAWWTEITAPRNGSVVQILHPDHGWLTFMFPPKCAERLGHALVQQAALCYDKLGSLPPSTVTIN
jgi:hypothetical protein